MILYNTFAFQLKIYSKFYKHFAFLSETMVIVNPKALPSATDTAAGHHVFNVVIDGAETTTIQEGVLRLNGGTLTVVSPGVLEVSRFRHVVVHGGGDGDVRFTRCGFAAAEACGSASFHRCDAVRVDGAREVAVRRCQSADVEHAGAVSLRRCKGAARVRGAGELRAGRCREANVSSCADVALGRCREARVDWCGALAVERCISAEVTRCGAVRVDRCTAASVSACGSVVVRRGKVNMVDAHQLQPQQVWKEDVICRNAEPAYVVPLEIMTK